MDEARRALLDVTVAASRDAESTSVTVWVDTAFNGHFVFPRQLIADLGLQQEAATEAVLADGSKVLLESFACCIHWFGKDVVAQVIANDGRLPLLGTELLADRRLEVDYSQRTVVIS